MFEGFIAPIIKNVLGDYIQDLEKTKLNYSLWKGDIVLHNLKIRKDALRRFHLPFDVIEGRVKDFYMQIPWNELKNKPVKITINGVYIAADAASTILSEEDLEQEFIWKLEALSTAELLLERRLKKTVNEDNSRFLERLLTKMVDNVQFQVSDIHISYTNAFSNEKYPYVLDLSLKELSAVSTDENYQPKFIEERSGCIYKLLKMDKLEAVWGPKRVKQEGEYVAYPDDQKRIVGPVSATAKIIAVRPYSPADSVNKVMLEFDDVGLCVDKNQYLSAISHFETLQTRYKREKYSQFRPPEGSTPMENPLVWFRFAVNCVLHDIRKKSEVRTIESAVRRIKDQRAYINSYLKHKKGLATEETMETMKALERKLSYEDLVLYRSMVISFMERENIKTVYKDQQERWSIRDAISSLWWGPSTEDQDSSRSKDDTMKALFETVDYDPNAEDAAQYTIKSAKLNVEFRLDTVTVEIKQFSGSDMFSREDLVTLRIDNLNTQILSNSDGTVGSFIIGNIVLESSYDSNSLFSVLIGPNSEKVSQLENEDDLFFKITFEDIKVDNQRRSNVAVEIFPLNIVLDIKTIKMIATYFNADFGAVDTLSIKDVAKDKLIGITHNTKAVLMNALKDRKTIDFKFDFYAPVLIIPENTCDADSSAIVIDLGRLMLESDSAKNAMVRATLDKGAGSNDGFNSDKSLPAAISEEAKKIDETLVDAIYEDFKCTITDVDVSVVKLSQIINASGSIEFSKQEARDIEALDIYTYQSAIRCSVINVCVGWRIIDDITDLPKVKIHSDIPSLNFQLSDYHFSRAYSVILIALDSLDISNDSIGTEKKCNKYGGVFKKIISEPNLLSVEDATVVDGDLFFEASDNAHMSPTDASYSSGNVYSTFGILTSVRIDKLSAKLIQSCVSEEDGQVVFTPVFDTEIRNLLISFRYYTKEVEIYLGIDRISLLDSDSNNIIIGESQVEEEGRTVEITYRYAKQSQDFFTKYIKTNVYVLVGGFAIQVSDEVIIKLHKFITSLINCTKSKSPKLAPKSGLKDSTTVGYTGSKISLDIKHVCLSVCYLNQKIATLALGPLSVSSLFLGNDFKVECAIGNVVVSSDIHDKDQGMNHTPESLFELTGYDDAKLTIIGSESDYASHEKEGRILDVKLEMNSAKFTYRERSFALLYEFYENWGSSEYFNYAARKVAINSAHRMQATSSELYLDLLIKSTTVVIPELAFQSKCGVIASLNELRISKKAVDSNVPEKCHHIVASVGSCNFSIVHSENEDLKTSSNDIIYADPLNLNIYLPHISNNHDVEATLNLSPFKLVLDLSSIEQLCAIYNALNSGTVSVDTGIKEKSGNSVNAKVDTPGKVYTVNISCPDICLLFSIPSALQNGTHIPQLELLSSNLEGHFVYGRDNFNATAKIASIALREGLSCDTSMGRKIFSSEAHDSSAFSFKCDRSASDCYQMCLDINSPSAYVYPELIEQLHPFIDSYRRISQAFSSRDKDRDTQNSTHGKGGIIFFKVSNFGIYVAQEVGCDVYNFLILELREFTVEYKDSANVDLECASISVGSGTIKENALSLSFKNKCVSLNYASLTLETLEVNQVINATVDQVIVFSSQSDILFLVEIAKKLHSIKFDTPGGDKSLEADCKLAELSEKANTLCRKCNFNIEKITLLFIGDSTEQNVKKYILNFYEIRASAELSREIKVDSCAFISASFFNVYNSRWEPIIERCDWNVSIQRSIVQDGLLNAAVDILLESKTMEVNLSYSLIKNILNTLENAKKSTSRKTLTKRNTKIECVVHNYTGIDMIIFCDNVISKNEVNEGQNSQDTSTDTLPDSTDCIVDVPHNGNAEFNLPVWWASSEKTKFVSCNLNISFEGMPLETLRGVSLDTSQRKIYTLKPAIKKIRHRVFCDTEVVGSTRHLRFWSGMRIINSTEFSINIQVLFPSSPAFFPKVGTINEVVEPDGAFNVPIAAAYYGQFYLQPSMPNAVYRKVLMFNNWSEIASTSKKVEIYSVPNTGSSRVIYLNMFIKPTKIDTYTHAHPFMDVYLRSPFSVENLLPYKITYRILDERNHELAGSVIEAGSTGNVYYVTSKNAIKLWVYVHSPIHFKSSDGLMIKPLAMDEVVIEMPVYDKYNRALHLFIRYVDNVIKIYCPYIILNKAGSFLHYRVLHLVSQPEFLAGQVEDFKDMAPENMSNSPFMFSSKNLVEMKSRLEFRAVDTNWGGAVDLQVVGTPSIVSLQSEKSKKTMKLSVYVSENIRKHPYTKLIHVEPYIYLKNTCGKTLRIICGNGKSIIRIEDKEALPMLYLCGDDKMCYLLSASFDSSEYGFSSFMSMIDLGPVYLKIPRSKDKEFEILYVEVLLVGSSMHVVFVETPSVCPYLFENMTEEEFFINQEGCKTIYKVPPQGTLPFTWDEPSSDPKLVVVSTGNKVIMKTDLFKMGTLETFKPSTAAKSATDIAVVSEARGQYTSILIAERKKAFGVLASHKSSYPNLSSQELMRYADMQVTSPTIDTSYNVSILVSSLGISVINKSVEEILYVGVEDLCMGYVTGPKGKYYEFGIGWLQIDDQSSMIFDQMLLYPTSTVKGEHGQKIRVLSISASGCADSMFGVNYFYSFNFLLQEITITLDEALLIDITEFLDVFNYHKDEDDNMFGSSLDVKGHKGDPPQKLRIYFKEFLIQPMKINLSLVKTRSIDEESPMIYSFTKYAFGNIHDAIVTLKALELKNARIKSFKEFSELIRAYYEKQLISQVYRLIGFADILGSPVGLFNNICSGMSDFFYEPLHGFELARPHYIGTHVAKGTASLVKKTVFGLSSTITKISSSIGEGLTAMTFDDSYQKRRHATRVRNRPRHAVHGVTRGAKALATSVVSGVSGIVVKPLKGAQSKGFEGFINGLGMGLVGAVTKPVIGVVDMATNFGEGIKNTTILFDDEIRRKRYTRVITEDKVLMPYDPVKAYGQYALANINYNLQKKSIYCHHVEYDDKILIISSVDIIEAKSKTFIATLRIAFDDIEHISQVGHTIQIFMTQEKPPRTLKLTSSALVKEVRDEAYKAYRKYCDSVLDRDF